MVESFIFSIAGRLLQTLSSPVFQELSSVWGVRDDLRTLENTVSCVRTVLLDAQERQECSHQLKNWLEKLENAMHHAQEVLKEFEIDALRYKVCDRTILRKVRREFSLSNRIFFRFRMAHKITKIRGKLDEIADNRKNFNLVERLDERAVVHREMTHSFVRDEDVIGRDKEREAVIRFLMNTTDDQSVSVLPLIGLGGIGKTTLAKLIYNEERIAAHFDFRIWVCISEEFELEKVIKEILKAAGVNECDNLPLEQLQKDLRKKLENHKYLLILDDVWNENHTKWVDLRNLLISGANGSKIVVTTRNASVASIMATSDLSIEVQGLSSEECLSLFFKWAFRSSKDASRYPHLVEIAGDIVRKCKGVPLAVKTLGSILFTNTDECEWINIRDSEIWKIKQKEGDIFPALKLSYYQLPSHLRRCFAFCSIFPKDYKFSNIGLTTFWQANGLLQHTQDNQDIDNIGMMYIKQLQSRGFFQDFENFGAVVSFKMHDFFHDLALLIGGRDCINLNPLDVRNCSATSIGGRDCIYWNPPEVRNCSSTRIVRHISFPLDYFNVVEEVPSWLLEQKENVHTFEFPNGVGVCTASVINTVISKFNSLRMLNLRYASFEVLPRSIGNMKHLKTLDLSNNLQLKKLPSSICDLVGLETLRFFGCLNIEKLPKRFGQLIRLRSLGLSTKELYLPDNEMRCLTSLQYLTIAECPNLKFVMSDNAMQCLSSLRSLYVRSCGSLVSLPIRGLSHLTRFETFSIFDCEHLNFTMNDRYENNTRYDGRGEIGLCNLQSLTIIGLPKIETLPLWLLQGSKNMKFIAIDGCDNLTDLVLLESLNSLQRIVIINCPKLKSLPEGMRRLTALREVGILDCPELERRCQRETGEDWEKICHVPNIYLDTRT